MKNSPNNILIVNPSAIDPEDEAVFKAFSTQDISENTKKALTGDLKHFLKWYVEVNQETFSFKRFTQGDVVHYKKYCESLKHKPSTINRRIMSLKALCKMAMELGKLEKDPMRGIKSLASQPLAPKSLTRPELHRLLKEVELRGNLRDRLIVEMLYGAGLRVSELVGLTIQDIKLGERSRHVVVRKGKGGKYRRVPLKKELRKLINQYLEAMKPEGKLFLGQRGPLNALAINDILEKYAKKANLKCSPHTLRHTFAYQYLNHHQGDIVGLAQILGHSSIQTTAIYVQHSLETLQERVEEIV